MKFKVIEQITDAGCVVIFTLSDGSTKTINMNGQEYLEGMARFSITQDMRKSFLRLSDADVDFLKSLVADDIPVVDGEVSP